MSEYTPDIIKEMVDNFMRAYTTEVEKNGLMEGNQFADNYLRDLSKDMPQEAADAFVKAASEPLSAFLTQEMKASEKDAESVTEDA